MKFRTFGYFFREAGRGLGRNGLMALAAATTMIVSLVILGVFMIVSTNLNHFADQAKNEIQLRIILKSDVTVVKAMRLRDLIVSTYKKDGVKSVKYISKEAGAADFEKTWKLPELFSDMEDNPLPDVLVVQLERGADINGLVAGINAMPGVGEIVYREFIHTLLLAVQILWIVGLALIALVSLGVLYIVVNTIRLTVFARRREIEIMRLVGATGWFIRWPFIMEGLILGLLGAVIAIVLLSKGYYFLFKSVRQIAIVPLASESSINTKLMLILLPAGLIFGIAGSFLSVKKFLRG